MFPKKWSGLSSKDLHGITEELTDARFKISGKGEFKDEFVTCGGVNRKEVNFKTMESKIVPGIYLPERFWTWTVLRADSISRTHGPHLTSRPEEFSTPFKTATDPDRKNNLKDFRPGP